jgi:metal iron transporter
MNCPSRTDDTTSHPGWNQSPPALAADSTTLADLNGIANLREEPDHLSDHQKVSESDPKEIPNASDQARDVSNTHSTLQSFVQSEATTQKRPLNRSTPATGKLEFSNGKFTRTVKKIRHIASRYAQFVGPGMLISVAYIDPGNYATDVGAGAETKFSLLFIVLLSNLFAIFLQALCIKLGSVTGKNLAENCREHLPKWLTIILYLLAESAIIATDIAEVIGSAIALNLLLHVPLVAGCAITIVDVLIILIFYRPNGSMTHIRIFEYFVILLVFGVTICFCFQLSYIRNASVGEVFRGYLPSSAVVDGNGIYLSCGVLGATVMPHSLYLGSELCQPRLRQFEINEGLASLRDATEDTAGRNTTYHPSVASIRSCLKYSIFELATSLFTFALFVNSAILIVAGSALYDNSTAAGADLFSIYHLLSHTLAPVAGTIFALALLLSGTSAGIVCTMAGQIVSDGFLNWSLSPWLRRLLTRIISITPSIIIAAAVGQKGLDTTLVASQVVLSVILPIVAAPLIWFTCRKHIMTTPSSSREYVMEGNEEGRIEQGVNMQNGWLVTVLAILIWLVLVVMNTALLVLIGLGRA